MIWTYGGGFTGGSGSDNWYDGEALAKKGVVVVTYNYRLGTFGFFAHPDLVAESPHHTTGNYAMTDMLAALHWVQKNVAAFGGDPRKVTIDGESAGAIAVAAMVSSPEAKGLFIQPRRKAARVDGPSSIAKQKTTAAEAEGPGQDGGGNALHRRIAGDVDGGRFRKKLCGSPGMIVDGWIIPEDQSITLPVVSRNDVDILVGLNRDEGTFFGGGNVTAGAGEDAGQGEPFSRNLAPDFAKLWASVDGCGSRGPARRAAATRSAGICEPGRSRKRRSWPQGERVLLHARASGQAVPAARPTADGRD